MTDWPEHPHFLDRPKLAEGVGLALSGGGYRAMIFHLGAIIRLNEMGWLKKLDRISSVSGGSITAGRLLEAWPRLTFDAAGIATNFDAEVRDPLMVMARTTIDIPSIAWGLLPGVRGSRKIADAYDRVLYHGAKLGDLTQTPRFVINAANMATGSLWRFSPEYAADWRIGRIDGPPFRLADVVAASSSFPPILSPTVFEMTDYPGAVMQDQEGTDLHQEPYTRRLSLTDGGVYDNLGLETVWGRYRTLIVSNAGRNTVEVPVPTGQWVKQLRRIISLIHMQPENLRERTLVAMAKDGHRKLAYWTIETQVADFGVDGQPPFSDADWRAAAAVATRLSRMPDKDIRVLMNAGYLYCDAAMRRYLEPTAAPPAGLPFPG